MLFFFRSSITKRFSDNSATVGARLLEVVKRHDARCIPIFPKQGVPVDRIEGRSVGHAHICNLTSIQDWLAEPQRGILWERIVQPFLNSAGHYLSIGNIGALDATTPLTGPIAAVFTAISFCFDIFPHLHAGGSGTSQPCLELYDRVRTRPAIESWYSSQYIASKPWTLSEYGTASWISDAARKSTL